MGLDDPDARGDALDPECGVALEPVVLRCSWSGEAYSLPNAWLSATAVPSAFVTRLFRPKIWPGAKLPAPKVQNFSEPDETDRPGYPSDVTTTV